MQQQMSMNKGLENSSSSERASGSYSPEGFNRLKASMKGKFQKNEKLLERIKKSQTSLKSLKQVIKDEGGSSVEEAIKDDGIIILKPYTDEEEGGIFQTPSKESASKEIFSCGETSNLDVKHTITEEEAKSEQKVQTFQNLDFIVLEHMNSVEEKDTGRSNAQSSESQEDQSAIEKYNQKHQFLKIANVRDLINQEDQMQGDPSPESPVKDLSAALDDMTSCIAELKKKRESKSLPAAKRNNHLAALRPNLNIQEEKNKLKLFAMVGEQRQSFGDIQAFQKIDIFKTGENQGLQVINQNSGSVEEHSIPQNIHKPPEDSERSKNALKRIEDDIRSRERKHQSSHYTDYLVNPIVKLDQTLETNKKIQEDFRKLNLSSVQKDGPEANSTRRQELLKISVNSSFPQITNSYEENSCTFRPEAKKVLYRKYLDQKCSILEDRPSIQSSGGPDLIDKYLETDKDIVSDRKDKNKERNMYLDSKIDHQWHNEQIYLLQQKLEDQGFQMELKDQQITKLQNRIYSDKEIIEKFDKQLGKMDKDKREMEVKQRENERKIEQMKVDMARLTSENRDFKRENQENVYKHTIELEKMETQYKELICLQKQQSSQSQPQKIQAPEQILSQQLREMTSVLEEFDEKYSRKEKQLEASRRQTDQIKESFESLKKLQNQTTKQLKKSEEENIQIQKEAGEKLNKMIQATQEKDQIFSELVEENQRLHLHVDNKDNLIKDQQQIITQLRDQLDSMQTEQENTSIMMSKLKETASRAVSQSRILSQENTRVSIERRQKSMERRMPIHQPLYQQQIRAQPDVNRRSNSYRDQEYPYRESQRSQYGEHANFTSPVEQFTLRESSRNNSSLYPSQQESLQKPEGNLDTMAVLQRSQYFRREYEKLQERQGELNLPLQRDQFQSQELKNDFQKGFDRVQTLYRQDTSGEIKQSEAHYQSQTFGGNQSSNSIKVDQSMGLIYTSSQAEFEQKSIQVYEVQKVKPSNVKIVSPRTQELKESPMKYQKQPKIINLELLQQNSSQKDLGEKSDFKPRGSSANLREKLLKIREFNNAKIFK